ncbi:LysR family transcriptional regulator [uncultured Hoeflea sp.]|uniref:LysR family transcriptional regulator n=1 Tax=uncultured Hoeflea sp. TaxID=538666 RepID=UPI0030ED3F53|tara:strand:+ start:102987 stop:103868 length:882 start_codon:yes stop_codon:yes gene_type:complete
MDKWAELRTAYQVAKLGTVSAAAELLGIHRATVNRHIDVLEAELGARIFLRHARGYALTELGEDVLRVAQKTDELIGDLAGRIRGGRTEIEGEIKLTILAPFAGLLMQAIAEFRTRNPLCVVTIDASEDLARLEYGEAHIAVRAGQKPEHPDYVVSSFGRVGFNLYAHESYIQRNGLPEDSSELCRHRFVVPPPQDSRLPFRPWIDEHVTPDMVALTSRDIWVGAEAVSAGIGIGFIGDHEAQRRGGLTAVLPPDEDWSVPGWLVTHVDLHRTEKVQAMLNCIKSTRQSQAAG